MTREPDTAELAVGPGAALSGRLRVPGDKSITHRALICAALAGGDSVIRGALDAADTRATARALALLGARMDWSADDVVRVAGTGGRFTAPASPLDLGNSGTGLRLLAGVIAGSGVPATLTGDASLRRRPMKRIVKPLEAMGVRIDSCQGRAPLALRPDPHLRGINYRLPVGSAQVKSAVLFAGLGAVGKTTIEDPFHTRDHTERMLPVFGAAMERHGDRISLQPGRLSGATIDVPGDPSSAAFLIASALLVPGSELILEGVGINPTRTGLLDVLKRMGARIEVCDERLAGAEPVADLVVKGSRLIGTRVSPDEIPGLIDELPILMVLAANAGGDTVIEGAGELRHKESDRIATMEAGLSALGVGMRVEGDTLHLAGGGFASGACVDGAGDHRVAMALSIAGLVAPGPVHVAGADWIATSFPDFPRLLRTAGADVAYW